jgi:ubiquinone/menaquinone biosynthesis C-methylase UbiE
MTNEKTPPICDYEGSDYQSRFWETGERNYEDGCEAYALKSLVPKGGEIMIELGAGAGRNTSRYNGFKQIVLLDYSRSQLEQARERLGESERFLFVVADIYRLPFKDQIFDSATMIRVLHHMADTKAAIKQIRNVLSPGATFILEFANKRNLKAILRYVFHQQTWNPFTSDPIEYTPLNFDFHPRTIFSLLTEMNFIIEKKLTVSHFRIKLLKKIVPTKILILADSLLQWTGALCQFTPSIFIRARLTGEKMAPGRRVDILDIFKCPKCNNYPLKRNGDQLTCELCNTNWPYENGLYIFKDA